MRCNWTVTSLLNMQVYRVRYSPALLSRRGVHVRPDLPHRLRGRRRREGALHDQRCACARRGAALFGCVGSASSASSSTRSSILISVSWCLIRRAFFSSVQPARIFARTFFFALSTTVLFVSSKAFICAKVIPILAWWSQQRGHVSTAEFMQLRKTTSVDLPAGATFHL